MGGASYANGKTVVPIHGVFTNYEIRDIRAEKVDMGTEGLHVTTNHEHVNYTDE